MKNIDMLNGTKEILGIDVAKPLYYNDMIIGIRVAALLRAENIQKVKELFADADNYEDAMLIKSLILTTIDEYNADNDKEISIVTFEASSVDGGLDPLSQLNTEVRETVETKENTTVKNTNISHKIGVAPKNTILIDIGKKFADKFDKIDESDDLAMYLTTKDLITELRDRVASANYPQAYNAVKEYLSTPENIEIARFMAGDNFKDVKDASLAVALLNKNTPTGVVNNLLSMFENDYQNYIDSKSNKTVA